MAKPIRIVVKMNRFPELAASVRQRADDACNITANNIRAEAMQLIQSGPKTGRIYRRGRRAHQASAPGEAPATDLGNLVNSGFVERVRQALWHVGFHAKYARGLEFGTPRILPRPFLRPAVEKYRHAFVAAIKQALA